MQRGLPGLFELVEVTLDSPDQQVREGSAIRIAHKLFRYEAEIRLLRRGAGASASPGHDVAVSPSA